MSFKNPSYSLLGFLVCRYIRGMTEDRDIMWPVAAIEPAY